MTLADEALGVSSNKVCIEMPVGAPQEREFYL